jgi:ABC-type multidrug transport system fused ATPase/permease subunit
VTADRQFLSLLRRYFAPPRATTAILLLVALTACTDLAAPWLVMLALDLLIGAEAAPAVASTGVGGVYLHLLSLAGVLAAVCILQYAARYAMTRLQARAVYRGAARLRDDLYDRLQQQPLAFHTGRRAGETLASLMTDVQVLQDAAIDLSTELPFDAMVLIGLLIAMCALEPLLGLVVLAFFVVAVGAALGLGRRGWAAHRAVLGSSARLMADMQEGLSGLRTTWLSGHAARERERMQDSVVAHSERLEGSGAVRAVVMPFLGLSEYLGVLLVLVLGGWSMLHHGITAGGLVALLAYMQMGAEPLARASEAVDRFQRAAAAGARLGELLAAVETAPAATGGLRPAIRGRVRAIGLEFAHPGSRQPALRGVEFTAEPGEVIGVLGRSGAGKSTLLDLLAGLHAPTRGRIEIDGVDLAAIDREHWRAAVGAVPQEVFLHNRSIADNIGFGAANLADVRRAAERAGIDEFVQQLPDGYDTRAGDRGALLSGGERQRIAIARLFLRDPRIVLLDEPTSALDVEAERQLLGVFRRLFAGRTTFLVTHRPLLLGEVDKVLVLQAGRLTYFGPPRAERSDFGEIS